MLEDIQNWNSLWVCVHAHMCVYVFLWYVFSVVLSTLQRWYNLILSTTLWSRDCYYSDFAWEEIDDEDLFLKSSQRRDRVFIYCVLMQKEAFPTELMQFN